MDDEFDRLAERGREAEPVRAASAKQRAARARAARNRQDQRMIDKALQGVGSTAETVLMIAGLLVLGAVLVGMMQLRMHSAVQHMVVLAVTFVLGGGLAFGAVVLWLRRKRTLELVWLFGLPFELDVERYLGLLTKKTSSRTVTLTARFSAQVPGDQKAAVRQVVSGASIDTAKCNWQGDGAQLVVVSPRLDTDQDYQGRITDGRTNAPVHAWVHRCIERALLVIHGRFPIAGIDIDAD